MKFTICLPLIAITLSSALSAQAETGSVVFRSKQRKIVRITGAVQSFYDVDGDGTADIVDVDRSDTFMQAYAPRAGQFTKLRVQQRKSNSIQVANFSITPDGKRYVLTSSSEEKPAKMFAQDVVVGICPDRAQVSELGRQIASMTRDLEGSSRSTPVRCQVQRTSNTLFDKSCSDSGFSRSLPAMMDGYASLIDDLANVDSKSPSKDPQFFKCLDKLQLGEHTSRIAAYLGRSMTLANAGKVFSPPAAATCNTEPETPTASRLTPPIKCQAVQDETFRGEYDPINSQITLRKSFGGAERSAGAAAQYKSVLFHELLHASGIDDEKLTGALETCCVQGLSDSNPACKVARERRNEIVRIQNHYEAFEKNFPGLPALRAQLEKDLDPVQAEALLNIYFGKLRVAIAAAEVEHAGCRATPEFCDSRSVETVSSASYTFFNNDCLRLIDKPEICRNANVDFSRMYRRDLSEVTLEPLRRYDFGKAAWVTDLPPPSQPPKRDLAAISKDRDADIARSRRAFVEAQSETSIGVGSQRPASNPAPLAPVDAAAPAPTALTTADMQASPVSMNANTQLGDTTNRSDVASTDSRATVLTDSARSVMRTIGSSVTIPQAEARTRSNAPTSTRSNPAALGTSTTTAASPSFANPFADSLVGSAWSARSGQSNSAKLPAYQASTYKSNANASNAEFGTRPQRALQAATRSASSADPKGSSAVQEKRGLPLGNSAAASRAAPSTVARASAAASNTPAEYQSRAAMTEFLSGSYAPVASRFERTDFRRALNKYKIAVQTKDSVLIGSGQPESCFNYSARSQRLVEGDCR